ncbi:MAG: sporulation initiation factor Spo0A C-terminal domain-containing protein [Candidatus Pelethousia sp.]|nr:sporulation initiation factor Spo0A C-terminal domain-containing protein [Candidatus Pelethousia sp.]
MGRSDYVETRLLRVGATPEYVGYPYLVDSILIVWEKPEAGRNITTQVYPLIAKKWGVSPASVERSIRTLIAAVWQNCDRRALVLLLGRDYERPPGNSKFIGAASRRLSLVYREPDETA